MPLLGFLTMNYPYVERIAYAVGFLVYVRVVLQEFAYLETLMFIGSGDREVTRRMFEQRYHSMEEGASAGRRSREIRESLLNVSYERVLAEEKVIKEVYEG
jgi:hypothetical protein